MDRSVGTPSAVDVDPHGETGAGHPRCDVARCVLIKSLLAFLVTWYLNIPNVPILIFALISICLDQKAGDSENQSDDVEFASLIRICGGSPTDLPPTEEGFDLDSLPLEVKGCILEHLDYETVFQLKLLSKSWKSLIESDECIHGLSLRKQPTLTACYFFIEKGVWQWAGFDPNWRDNSSSTNTGKWRRLPPLTFLPANCDPDADLFKQFLFCSKDGLVCMNFSKSPHEERLIVFNPLTQHWKELPPLLHRRNPVLMHMRMYPSSKSYRILVAGSSGSGDNHLSKITEIYDSRTGQWQRVGDLPGPDFALNDYQAGVFQNGNIFCTGFVEVNDQVTKGILGYNVEKGIWSTKWTLPTLPSSTILQLVENSGELYLFSERENGRFTEHWVDRLECTQKEGDEDMNTCNLINVIKKNKIGGRSLEVYPEFALVPHSQRRLCIYNTVDHAGEVYDIDDQEKCESLPALAQNGFRGELGFFSLNPISFGIEPRFSTKV